MGDTVEHAVDPVQHMQSVRACFEVNVAGFGLEAVIQRRVDDAHHRALVFRDLCERQFLGVCRETVRVARGDAVDGRHRAHAFFAPRQPGFKVGGVGERAFQRVLIARFDLGAAFVIKRVGEDDKQHVVELDHGAA